MILTRLFPVLFAHLCHIVVHLLAPRFVPCLRFSVPLLNLFLALLKPTLNASNDVVTRHIDTRLRRILRPVQRPQFGQFGGRREPISDARLVSRKQRVRGPGIVDGQHRPQRRCYRLRLLHTINVLIDPRRVLHIAFLHPCINGRLPQAASLILVHLPERHNIHVLFHAHFAHMAPYAAERLARLLHATRHVIEPLRPVHADGLCEHTVSCRAFAPGDALRQMRARLVGRGNLRTH